MSARHLARASSLALALALPAACLSTTLPEPVPAGLDASDEPPDAATPRDAGPGPDATAPPPLGAVRVTTFNTHLFFDPICQSGACGHDDFEQQPTEAGFAFRADQIAAGLRSLSPTFVLLQEVETRASLDALEARLSDVLPVAVLGESGYAGSVDSAVLARGELLEVRRHAGGALTLPDGTVTSFTRPLLEVHVALDRARVILFAAHFKSKNNDDPARRLAEAQATARIVEGTARRFPGALVVVGGDLNDDPGSPPLEALTAGGGLLRVAQELPVAGQVTYKGFGGHAYDHLFQGVAAGGRFLPGHARVTCDEAASPGGFAGSDHCALSADFVP